MTVQRLRVLLVEDEPGDARLVTGALKQSRSPAFTVVHDLTLTGALARLAEGEPFDVVLLDLSLPDSSGIETLRRMQQAQRSLPIVIMTGLDDPAFAEGALEAGAQDYLVKSDEPERTVARSIRYAISRKHAELERQALADRLAVEYERIADELALARTMQFDLLPPGERLGRLRSRFGLKVDGFFQPSSNIGGDLWGCAESEGGRAVFYTFDFSGHGVGAALNVFRLHTLISELDRHITDPAATLGHLNRVLCNLLPRGQYATMVLVVVDPAAATLTWSAAGAPAPILFDGEGEARLLDSRGRPLGIANLAQYVNRVAPFPEGSCLFLYSDVMTESMGADGEMLGDEGLLALARDHHALKGGIDVAGLAESFVAQVGAPLADDMTAVGITRLVRPGESAPVVLIDGLMSPDLADQCEAMGAHALANGEAVDGAGPSLLASARSDLLAEGLAPPHGGFLQVIDGRLTGVAAACIDAVARGGLCLSLSTPTAWSCGLARQVGLELRRRFGGVGRWGDAEWEGVDLCLGEMISNAVIHGNLGIVGGLRETRASLDRYDQDIRQGLADPIRAARRIELTVVPLDGGRLEIAVSDHGAGFDFARHHGKAISPGAKHGQGLALLFRLAQSVVSRDGGRTIAIVV